MTFICHLILVEVELEVDGCEVLAVALHCVSDDRTGSVGQHRNMGS